MVTNHLLTGVILQVVARWLVWLVRTKKRSRMVDRVYLLFFHAAWISRVRFSSVLLLKNEASAKSIHKNTHILWLYTKTYIYNMYHILYIIHTHESIHKTAATHHRRQILQVPPGFCLTRCLAATLETSTARKHQKKHKPKN